MLEGYVEDITIRTTMRRGRMKELTRTFNVEVKMVGPECELSGEDSGVYVKEMISRAFGWDANVISISDEVRIIDDYDNPLYDKLAMAKLESDDNVFLKVSDIIPISAIPENLKEFIVRYVGDIKILDNGLPASGFLGKSGCKVTGIFKYGDLGFISYRGSEESLESEELVHIFSNVSEEDYEKIKSYAEQQLEEIENSNSEVTD